VRVEKLKIVSRFVVNNYIVGNTVYVVEGRTEINQQQSRHRKPWSIPKAKKEGAKALNRLVEEIIDYNRCENLSFSEYIFDLSVR